MEALEHAAGRGRGIEPLAEAVAGRGVHDRIRDRRRGTTRAFGKFNLSRVRSPAT